MGKILRLPCPIVPSPAREDIATKELRQTCIDLESIEHEIIATNSFNLDQHLRETAQYLFYVSEEDDGWAIRRAGGMLVEKHGLKLAAVKIVSFFRRDWIENHRNHAGYAVRFDDKVWPDIAELLNIPLVRVQGETYLLLYDRETVTAVMLAAYQALSLGVVDPSMVDVVVSETFRVIMREKYGVMLLASALDRLLY